jgi:hypothetical protein
MAEQWEYQSHRSERNSNRLSTVGKSALHRPVLPKSAIRHTQVFVEGRLRTRELENNGSSSQRTEIIAPRVQFLGAPPTDAKAEKPSGDVGLVAESDVPF